MEEIKEACGIKIGDYIRTTSGIITKIVRIEDTMLRVGGFVNGIGGTHEHRMQKVKLFRTNHGETVLQEEIKKNSKNIIDLIEVGDYVNGKEVVYDVYDTDTIDKHKCIGVSISNDNSTTWTIADIEIKSIVTREAMKSVEYTIE